ncbi:hypothetical protein Taro_029324 [Colocasia esculenta]|uniref:HAUS augmin-like complex subunit 3 N-terminal domain-containing protein n=1 Tax=Colocasia esculenta TaxID=4460 RepID=A0A843VDJ0_COLES|nr:hypothetical protein [Colocasia esculenta]
MTCCMASPFSYVVIVLRERRRGAEPGQSWKNAWATYSEQEADSFTAASVRPPPHELPLSASGTRCLRLSEVAAARSGGEQKGAIPFAVDEDSQSPELGRPCPAPSCSFPSPFEIFRRSRGEEGTGARRPAAEMSGTRLCCLLEELGFDGGHGQPLDPDSFEWPFQCEEARPVLEWICSTLRPSNVLSPAELSQYEQLLHEGKLLEGDDLDSAYDSISAFSSRRDDHDAVFGTEERLIDIRSVLCKY